MLKNIKKHILINRCQRAEVFCFRSMRGDYRVPCDQLLRPPHRIDCQIGMVGMV